MPRPPRPDVPGCSHHVVQRGNNRLPCFLGDHDRRTYLQLLGQCLPRYECDLHAYVLMDNHVHLLISPREPKSLPKLMQTFGRNYAVTFNRRYGRPGTLWEGRYDGHLVDNDAHLLACYRYIELNPVRARMVASPEAFPWSSHRGNCGQVFDRLLTPHNLYRELHREPLRRFECYRRLFDQPLPEETVEAFRSHLKQRAALGSDAFRKVTEAKLRRFTGVRPAHRPRRSPD
ncbi:transposase [Arenimonas composti]|uniref:transposase n=1 Tax=Arenimonas composti TaxID=370776 RepID=UPI00047E73C9|nr:transposase [Arenimonas composti]